MKRKRFLAPEEFHRAGPGVETVPFIPAKSLSDLLSDFLNFLRGDAIWNGR